MLRWRKACACTTVWASWWAWQRPRCVPHPLLPTTASHLITLDMWHAQLKACMSLHEQQGSGFLWPDAEVAESVRLHDCVGQLVGLAEAQVCSAPSPPNRGPSLDHSGHAQLDACMCWCLVVD